MNSKAPTKPNKQSNQATLQLPEELQTLLSKLPADQRQEMLVSLVKITQSYQGPLPHPEHLTAFNKIIPHGAERIMKIYEGQVTHRQGLEKQEIKIKARGQIFGFAVAASAFVFAGFALYIGEGGIAIGTIITAIAALIGAFIAERKMSN